MRLLVAVLLTSAALAGGSLSVRVLNSVTGAGIPGVRFRICLFTAGAIHCGNTNYNVVSDINGAFHIASLTDGEYAIINLEAKGFQATGSTSIHVSGDSQFDLRLAPNANIRGRVFDPEGKPAAGVSVTVSNRGGARLTNENGEFLIEGVGSSSGLILTATPNAQIVAKTASKDGTQIVTTYYPSAITIDQAVRINLTGVDASYDIHLQTALARVIRGVVIGVDGKPARNVRVTISRNETEPISFVRGSPAGVGLLPQTTAAQPVDTADDGTFTFPPVIAGDWTLSAVIPNGGETTMGLTRVSVSARDATAGEIPNVQIQLAKPFDVEVTADWGDAAPPKDLAGLPFVTAIPLDPAVPLVGWGSSSGEPGEPQQLRLFPGRYFIGEGRANGMLYATGFYAATAMLDGHDVLNHVIDVSGPASIQMIYKSGGGSVHGVVEKGPGATPETIIGYMSRCDENGAFTISDLPPGEYTAVALTGAFFVDPRTPDFVTAANRDGKRIKVEAGAATQVDLRLAITQ